MNWQVLIPSFVLTLWRLTIMVGVIELKDGYQFASVHLRRATDPRIGFYFYWLMDDDPMVGLQIAPYFIAYMFWCFSNEPPEDKTNDSIGPLGHA